VPELLRTTLIVEVPAAEPLVSEHRLRMDRHSALGVPAHVTVLYPFAPLRDVDDTMLGRLAALFGSIPAFDFCLERIDWFGDAVVWIAPEPAERFRELTQRVLEQFPAYPPFGGEFSEVVPHLTIADHAPIAAMSAAAAAVEAHLPVQASAASVAMLAEQPSQRWERLSEFPLGREWQGGPGRSAQYS
jgi:2'-5' RNA ligase